MGDRTLTPEEVVSTPGLVVVVDEHGLLRDRSPRAAEDPFLGLVNLTARLPLDEKAEERRRVADAAPYEALWLSRGEAPITAGLGERDFGTMLYRLRNQLGVVLGAMDTEALVGDGPVSERLGGTRRREVERLVDASHALGFAFGPVGGRREVDPDLVVRRSMDTVRGRAQRLGVTLRLSLGRSARRRLSGDQSLLQAGVDALVANALDASREGGEIRVVVEPGPCSMTIAIEDDGPGLLAPEGAAPETPFVTTKRAALGIGLSVALRAAAVHLGELAVATRGPKGTSAKLWLPVVPG